MNKLMYEVNYLKIDFCGYIINGHNTLEYIEQKNEICFVDDT